MTDAPAPTRTRRNMSAQARAEQLLHVAEELFVDRGYIGTTIEDIARAAGVTRPMIYLHYAPEDGSTSAKDGIYLACVRRIRAAMEQAVYAAVATTTDPREQLRRSADAYFAFQEEQPRRWALVFAPSGLSNSDLDGALTQERFLAIGIIADLFAAHAPHADRDRLEAHAHSLSGSLDQLARWWATRPDIPRSVLLEHHMAFAWNGLQALLHERS